MALDDAPHGGIIDAGHLGQQVDRPVEVLDLLPHERDIERVAVLDQHLTVAVEHDPTRRTQRDAALMVILGHLEKPRVLAHLEMPEPDEEDGEDQRHRDLKQREEAPSIAVVDGGGVVLHQFVRQRRVAKPPRRIRARSHITGARSHAAAATIPTRALANAWVNTSVHAASGAAGPMSV